MPDIPQSIICKYFNRIPGFELEDVLALQVSLSKMHLMISTILVDAHCLISELMEMERAHAAKQSSSVTIWDEDDCFRNKTTSKKVINKVKKDNNVAMLDVHCDQNITMNDH